MSRSVSIIDDGWGCSMVRAHSSGSRCGSLHDDGALREWRDFPREAAKEADAELLLYGGNQQIDHEAHDRTYLHLLGVQHELAKAVRAVNPRTILVIVSNCRVAVIWEQENLAAIVGGMFLGQEQEQEQGHALADASFGAYNPGGKVSTTWYRHVDDLPAFHDYNMGNGRTYMYFQGVSLYPLGHGLSYTTFEYSGLRVTGDVIQPGGKISVEMLPTNTGAREGDERIQFYVHVPSSAPSSRSWVSSVCTVPPGPAEPCASRSRTPIRRCATGTIGNISSSSSPGTSI